MIPITQARDWRDRAVRCGIPQSMLFRPSVMVAQLLAVRGEADAAESACRETLQSRPDDIAAWKWLASTLERQARLGESESCRRRIHEIELRNSGLSGPAIAEAVDFRLAAEGYGLGPARAPGAYVSAIFDSCAQDFDAHLRKRLKYRGPELVCGALKHATRRRRRLLDVLDAGCGTGLAGPLLRPIARHLDGVDLSPRMLERARACNSYDSRENSDLIEALARRCGRYDAIVAVDVLVYFGDLAPVLASARIALRRHGLFAFSVEAGTADSYALGPARRYVHSESYLRQTAAAVGFAIIALHGAPLRLENGKPVIGWIAVLRRFG